MSLVGTRPTRRGDLTISVDRDRPEGTGPRSKWRERPKGDIKPRAQLRPVLIFPYLPADLQHCFRDAVGIPDRAPTVSEVEELWKQDRIRLIVNKRCGERMQTWYSIALPATIPTAAIPTAATALECRMATTFTARRGGHQCDNCLKGSHTNT